MTPIDPENNNLRLLYKSYLSCSDFLPPEILNLIHIVTPVEDKIILSTRERKIVFATGNPGDGKTHLIRRVQENFPKNVEVILDANEKDDAVLASLIDKAYDAKSGIVIAINEGILLDLCEKHRKRNAWSEPVINMILRPYVYMEDAPQRNEQLVVLDLSLRNNLSPGAVAQAIQKVISLAPDFPESPLRFNIECFKNETVQERIIKLLDAVGRIGYHATMRDLFGFLSFLLCGGAENDNEGVPNPYYINAFSGGVGPLFELVRRFDPVFMPLPFLDETIFMGDDKDEDWIIDAPDEIKLSGDMDAYMRRKRRAFFEHKDGEKILRPERDEVDRTFKKLITRDQSPEYTAIALLNKFFDSRDLNSLVLWFSHQFSAKSPRYVASRQEIATAEFEVLIPRLPNQVCSAFPDHYPNHVILKHKDMQISEGLIMDRRFVAMLMAGDRMSGLGVRSLEVQSKISAFYDRLTRVNEQKKNVVQILRLDNQKSMQIGISERKFFIPGT